jgi:5-methylcytosine-specific restriction endonuclease McrA
MAQDKKCERCGESDSRVIERHHIFGRNSSPEVMLLCKNCHYKITHEQNKIAPKERSKDASPENSEKFTLVSIGGLLQETGKIIEKSGNMLLEIAKQKG